MSGIIGIFSAGGPLPAEGIVRGMLSRTGRGGDRTETRRCETALVGVTRAAWEAEEHGSRETLAARRHALSVVADASLYYRPDLRTALAARGIRSVDDSSAHLIAAALAAWNQECTNHLEGDFAWIAWDQATGTGICARDFVGTRPLYYARIGETLVVASSISAVLYYPGCPAELNLPAIADTAAGLFASSRETCYRSVAMLPAGSMLVWKDGAARVVHYWSPPRIEARTDPPFERAAEELRELLRNAVAERMDPARPTSVWLSGGWDSSAVFAAGQQAIREGRAPNPLRPVSISYPPGDPGREDELIGAIAVRWSAPVRWIGIESIPLLDRPYERAGARDEPFAHVFEMWNRALAGGSADAGARVALTGVGGDHLFQNSPIYLADLFRTGRWLSLRRDWKARGLDRSGLRSLLHWAVWPMLPAPLGRRRSGGYLERMVPDWIEPRFAGRARLQARERANTPRRVYRSHAAHEMYWMLTYPYGARIMACVFALGLGEGVEIRSPLLDSRIVRFAAKRPASERASGAETKRLLRHAMKGLLPDHVLRPRQARTGVTSGYLDRSLRGEYARLLLDGFRDPMLAQLGIVNPSILRRRCNDYIRTGGTGLGAGLFLTLQTELWVRTRLSCYPALNT